MTEATPRPWKIGWVGQSIPTLIQGENDRQVATSGGYTDNTLPDWGREENEANAALIVKAVNRDDAFQELVTFAQAVRTAFAVYSPVQAPNGFLLPHSMVIELVRLAEAALKRAGETL